MENKKNQNSTNFCIDIPAFDELITNPRFIQVKNDAEGKELVLFLGLTGAGKSACINYLLGVKLERCKNIRGGAKLSDTQILNLPKKLPEIGVEARKSCTIYSEIFSDPIVDIAYCDSAGFLDTRKQNSHYAVCSTFSKQLAVQSARNIKAIFVVIEWSTFYSRTSGEVEKLMFILNQLLINPIAISDSILFLINKIPSDVKTNKEILGHIVAEYKESLEEEVSLCSKAMNTQHIIPSDFEELKGALHFINLLDNQIKQNSENIILLDLFDAGESRQQIHTWLREKVSPIAKNAFNFREYNPQRKKFEQEIETIVPLLQVYRKQQLEVKDSEQSTATLSMNCCETNDNLQDISAQASKEGIDIKNDDTTILIVDLVKNAGPLVTLDNTSQEPLSFSNPISDFDNLLSEQIDNKNTLNPENNTRIVLNIVTSVIGTISVFLFITALGGIARWSWAELIVKGIFHMPLTNSIFLALGCSAVAALFCGMLIIYPDSTNAEETKLLDNAKHTIDYKSISLNAPYYPRWNASIFSEMKEEQSPVIQSISEKSQYINHDKRR